MDTSPEQRNRYKLTPAANNARKTTLIITLIVIISGIAFWWANNHFSTEPELELITEPSSISQKIIHNGLLATRL